MSDIDWRDGPVRNGGKESIGVSMAALHSLQIRQQHVNAILPTAPCLLHVKSGMGQLMTNKLRPIAG